MVEYGYLISSAKSTRPDLTLDLYFSAVSLPSTFVTEPRTSLQVDCDITGQCHG